MMSRRSAEKAKQRKLKHLSRLYGSLYLPVRPLKIFGMIYRQFTDRGFDLNQPTPENFTPVASGADG